MQIISVIICRNKSKAVILQHKTKYAFYEYYKLDNCKKWKA